MADTGGLQMSDAVAGQQGNTPEQQAAVDQAATAPATPNFSNISSTNLQPSTPVSLPAPTPLSSNTTAVGAVAANTQPSIQDYINKLTPAPTQLDQTQSSILDSIAQLTGQDANKSADLATAESNGGLPALQQQLTDLNGQLTTGNAQLRQLQTDAMAKQSNIGAQTGISSSVVSAQQAEATRQAQIAEATQSSNNALIAAQAQ